MSYSNGPLIVTNGLSFYTDFGNIKSYNSSYLIDLTGNNTFTALNVSSNAIGKPYLNGYGTNIAAQTASTSLLNNDYHSIFFMIRFNTTSAYGSNGYSGNWDQILGYPAPGTDRSPGIWRWPSNKWIHWRYDPSNTGINIGAAGTTGDTTPSVEFTIDKWYYVGCTKNASTLTCYINGVNGGSGSVSIPKTSGNTNFNIFNGYTTAGYPQDLVFLGLIKVYNRALTDSEVIQNFNALRGRFGL